MYIRKNRVFREHAKLIKGSRKKSSSLNGRAIKRGGGVKGQAIKERGTFLEPFFYNVPTAIKFEGGVRP